MKGIMFTLILGLLPHTAFSGDREASFTEYLVNPTLVAINPPEYPALALQFSLQGRVEVMVWVDQEGNPSGARIAESSSVIFDEVALRSALRSRFSPALGHQGAPVPSVVRIPFVFRLR